jgi:glycosidase
MPLCAVVRLLAVWLVSVLLWIGCGDDDLDLDRSLDVNPPPPGDRDSGRFDAPKIAEIDPIEMDRGTSQRFSLRAWVHDPDTAYDQLTIELDTSQARHVTAEIDGEELALTAPEDWAGVETFVLTATDPLGLSGSGSFDVRVRVPDEIPPDDEPAPARDCTTHLRYDSLYGSADSVAFASEANDWSTTANPLTGPDESGVFTLDLELPPGRYGYKFVLDGDNWILDPENPYLLEVDGVVNSQLIVPGCEGPLLDLAEVEADAAAGTVEWKIDVFDSPGAPGIDVDSFEATVNRQAVADTDTVVVPTQIRVLASGVTAPDRLTLRATVADVEGARSEVLLAPVWVEEEAFSWSDAVIYFAFIDRFRNGRTDNDGDQGLLPIVDWMGGDFAGLTAKIEEGYFDDLGVNAIWISSPNDNPDGTMIGETGEDRTAYHAYFPSAPRSVENHFGTMEELRALTAAAHAHGIRVITDFVANHVYETHTYYVDRTSDGEFNDLVICRDINWSAPITCWFEPYLPDFNYALRSNVERTVADALWWIDAADLDGFRVDAVKHMDHNVGYVMRAAVDHMLRESDQPFFMIGETFVGQWSEFQADQLAEYISPAELDGQFNFPLMWEIVFSIARRESDSAGFGDIDQTIRNSEARFPPPALMGIFAGNHDLPRLVSHASGDIASKWGDGATEQGLNDPPPQPTSSEPYRRVRVALALVLTLPGVPTLYYGDEIGLAGAGDPDNRRPYPWDEALSSERQELLQTVQQLGQLRRDRDELRRGTRETLVVDGTSYVYLRALGDDVTIVALNNGASPAGHDVDVSGHLADGTSLREVMTGASVAVSGGALRVDIPATDIRIYVTD